MLKSSGNGIELSAMIKEQQNSIRVFDISDEVVNFINMQSSVIIELSKQLVSCRSVLVNHNEISEIESIDSILNKQPENLFYQLKQDHALSLRKMVLDESERGDVEFESGVNSAANALQKYADNLRLAMKK